MNWSGISVTSEALKRLVANLQGAGIQRHGNGSSERLCPKENGLYCKLREGVNPQ